MNSTTNQEDIRYDELEDEIREQLIEAGFCPVEFDNDADLVAEYGEGHRGLGWLGAYRWDAYRILSIPAGKPYTGNLVALVQWSEDGILLEVASRNGVTFSAARFNWNTLGLKLLAGAIAAVTA